MLQCDDATIWFDVVGEGAPLVTLHGGLGLDHSYFRPWLDPLTERMTVVFYDHRANGRSTGGAGSLTMQRLADDLEALRSHLGHERISLLGHSYGGFIALEYALSYPERAAALVLCDADSTSPDPEVVVAGLQRLGAGPEAMEAMGAEVDTAEDMRRWWRSVARYYVPHTDESVAVHAMDEVVFSKDGHEAGNRALAEWNVGKRLQDIETPTLVVCGRDDFMFGPERAQPLADGIAGAELHVFEASGHLPFVEQQEDFLREIGAFVERHT